MNYKKWISLFLALALIFAANNMLDFNIVGIPMMIAGVASLIYFFYCVYRDKHKKSQIV